jgi:hypothetical protein
MKKLLFILFLLLALGAMAQTTFTYAFLNPDGTPNTNKVGMTMYPPSVQLTIAGTNLVWGQYGVTLTPFTNGCGTNTVEPGTYNCLMTNANIGFVVQIPVTASIFPLANYVTNGAAVALSAFQFITNMLGYTPAPQTYSGITTGLGFNPATNSNSGITNALGYIPATNTWSGITNALGYIPPTNSFTGLTNALGYQPATNYSFSTNYSYLDTNSQLRVAKLTNGMILGIQ